MCLDCKDTWKWSLPHTNEYTETDRRLITRCWRIPTPGHPCEAYVDAGSASIGLCNYHREELRSWS